MGKIWNNIYQITYMSRNRINKSQYWTCFIWKLTKSDNTNAEFIIEIRDNNDTLLWDSILKKTDGKSKTEFFVLPADISEKQVKLDVKIQTKGKSVHTLAFNNFSSLR